MKKISLYILCFTCLIGLETCNKPEALNKNAIKVRVDFDETHSGGGQKLLIDGTASPAIIKWTSGDELKFNNGNDLTLSYSGSTNGTADFTSSGGAIPDGDYIGVHPKNAAIDINDIISYTAQMGYDIDPSALDLYITPKLLMYTAAKYTHGNNTNLALFTPAMTILEIPIKTESGTYHITSISLKSTGASNAFIQTATFPIGSNPTVSAQSSGQTMTYNFTGGLTATTTEQTIKLLVWSNSATATSGLTGYKVGINTYGTSDAVTKTLSRTSPFINSKYYKYKSGEAIEIPTSTANEILNYNGIDYKTIKIGSLVWMAENLRTTKYKDGITDITNITDANTWKAATTAAYCWYDDISANAPTYGALYNWYTVNTGNLCPNGWRVPSSADWDALYTNLGGLSKAGSKLKEAGTTHWTSGNLATNVTGFTALPVATRDAADGTFGTNGTNGYFWSSTSVTTETSNRAKLSYNLIALEYGAASKKAGMSVRCVKDIPAP